MKMQRIECRQWRIFVRSAVPLMIRARSSRFVGPFRKDRCDQRLTCISCCRWKDMCCQPLAGCLATLQRKRGFELRAAKRQTSPWRIRARSTLLASSWRLPCSTAPLSQSSHPTLLKHACFWRASSVLRMAKSSAR